MGLIFPKMSAMDFCSVTGSGGGSLLGRDALAEALGWCHRSWKFTGKHAVLFCLPWDAGVMWAVLVQVMETLEKLRFPPAISWFQPYFLISKLILLTDAIDCILSVPLPLSSSALSFSPSFCSGKANTPVSKICV